MSASTDRARRAGRWLELALLFGLGPYLLSLGPRWLVLPAIVGCGLVCLLLLLADSTFDRTRLLGVAAARRALPALLVRAVAICAALLVVAAVTRGPANLFQFPRARPAVWLAVAVLYPMFSVYPQEIIYRAFFFHRYGNAFRRPSAAIAVNAVLFGWAHVMVHNWAAVALSAAGGLLFASSYLRSRSTLLAACEHAIYGDFVFTVGLGGMFVNGVRLLSKVMR